MTRPLTIALAQLRSALDPAHNAEAVARLAREAWAAGAQVLVCPEATMASFAASVLDAAEPTDGSFATRMREIAREHHLLLVVGMFEPAPDGRVFNTLLVTDGADVEARYRKMHLYDAFGVRESDTVAPGDRIVTVPALGTTIGFATCYDVRFADQFTALGRAGAEVVCLPASWGDGPTKVDQWRDLTTVRAMDAQAWLLAAGQAFTDTGGRRPLGVGFSRVVGPLGRVAAEAGPGVELLVHTIDLDAVADARARVPVLWGRTPVSNLA